MKALRFVIAAAVLVSAQVGFAAESTTSVKPPCKYSKIQGPLIQPDYSPQAVKNTVTASTHTST